jgi:hypothetical protein
MKNTRIKIANLLVSNESKQGNWNVNLTSGLMLRFRPIAKKVKLKAVPTTATTGYTCNSLILIMGLIYIYIYIYKIKISPSTKAPWHVCI